MAGLLENFGYLEAADWQTANLVLVNTCSIRDKAERRVLGKFHELDHFRRKNNLPMKLAIMGCMPQHAKKFIQEKFNFIDYVIGTNNMEELPSIIKEGIPLEKQIKKLRIKRREKEVIRFEEEFHHQKRKEDKKAWVSIQFGCNKVCSFCIVPFTRGREISRKKEHIFKEITSLEEKGFSEIVLLGQNVNSYGLTTYDKYNFANLLEDIARRFTWLKKINFLTSYPSDVNEELVDVIANYDNITKEIHFPLQHGDNTILKLMERNYTVEEYLEKVEMIRKKIPQVSLGTDLIVGFPGEKDIHFENMLKTLEKINFSFANTAAYSIRPGTKASRMENQVDEKTKKARLLYLNRFLDGLQKKQIA